MLARIKQAMHRVRFRSQGRSLVRPYRWTSNTGLYSALLYSGGEVMSEKTGGMTGSRGFHGSVDTLLDTKGMNCPMPLLKAKQALNRMDGGQILEVTSTDQGSVRDFQVFATQSGNELLGQTDEGSTYIHWIKKA